MWEMKYHQPRLILTPKVPSSLGAVPLKPDVAKLVDPNSEFDLLDIRLELEEIEARNAAKHGSPIAFRDPDHSVLTASKRFGGNVSEVANFGRGGFRMQLSDSEFSSDDDDIKDEDGDDGSDKENSTTAVAVLEKDPHSPIEQRFASPSARTDLNWWYSAGREASPLLPKADEAESALREINREMLLKVKEEIKQTQLQFEEQFNQEQRRAAEKFTELEREEATRRERARRTDKQDLRMIAEARDLHLSALQRDREQRTQVEERAIRKEVEAEEARKREIERREQQRKAREEAEIAARRRAEAEREKAAKDAAERKAKADASAAAALQRAAMLQAEKQEKGKQEPQQVVKSKAPASEEIDKTVPSAVPKPRTSEEAARQENERLAKLKEMKDSYKDTLENPALKTVRNLATEPQSPS